MDSIVSWNIRGLNWLNKQDDVKFFLYNNKVGMIGLLETKVKVQNVERVVAKVFSGRKWHQNFTPSIKGCIWIGWKPNSYEILVLKQLDQLIHCHAAQISTNKRFYITFVYGLS